MLFGGNLLKQPAFVQLRHERPEALRLVKAEMPGADRLVHEALFLGTYPGLTGSMLAREVELIKYFARDEP
jgi:CDP-6-deoxy-D-xylo-4-hexulose-3-dehydrase